MRTRGYLGTSNKVELCHTLCKLKERTKDEQVFTLFQYMNTIQCKYNSVFILRTSHLGALVKYTSILEENKLVSN